MFKAKMMGNGECSIQLFLLHKHGLTFLTVLPSFKYHLHRLPFIRFG